MQFSGGEGCLVDNPAYALNHFADTVNHIEYVFAHRYIDLDVIVKPLDEVLQHRSLKRQLCHQVAWVGIGEEVLHLFLKGLLVLDGITTVNGRATCTSTM